MCCSVVSVGSDIVAVWEQTESFQQSVGVESDRGWLHTDLPKVTYLWVEGGEISLLAIEIDATGR